MKPSDRQQASFFDIVRAVVGSLVRYGLWLFGTVWFVFSCGLLLLWWTHLRQAMEFSSVERHASMTAQARLIDRYYRLDRRDGRIGCEKECTLDWNSVAVFEFTPPEGQAMQVEFVDSWFTDWADLTPFEQTIPLLRAAFRMTPQDAAFVRQTPSTSDAHASIWNKLWEQIDDATHWLVRLRQPAPDYSAPLRYDSQEPSVALLDLPVLREQRASDIRRRWTFALQILPIVVVFCVWVLYPSVKMMLWGASRRTTITVTLTICLAVPLWAPYALSLANLLDDFAGRLARELGRDFNDTPPMWLARPVTHGLHEEVWSLPASEDAWFFQGLQLVPSAIDALDHVSSYAALTASIDAQLQKMPAAQRIELIERLHHFRADNVWELFVPALLHRYADPHIDTDEAAAISRALGFFAGQWRMPEQNDPLAQRRLENYALLQQIADPELSALATRRLREKR